jgi:ketosteroid isomerase-like protein
MLRKSLKDMGIITLALFGLMVFYENASKAQMTTKEQAVTPQDSKAILQADRDFARMASDSGISIAFVYFAADSATMLRRGSTPIVGRKAIRALFADEAGTTLKWDPYYGDIAASGDLGFTLGKSQYIYKDSTGAEKISYGYYVTIWKKQSDGSWKYVLDTGVSAPPPEK